MKLSNLRRLYIHHKIIFTKGYSEVNYLMNIWNTSAILLLTLSHLFGRSIFVVWLVCAIMPIVLGSIYLIGYTYYKRGFFDEEFTWLSKVSPPHLDIIHRLESIQKELQHVKANIRTHN